MLVSSAAAAAEPNRSLSEDIDIQFTCWWCRVALAGVYCIFVLLTLLIEDRQWAAILGHQFNFNLAVFPVCILIGGRVGETVLIPATCGNVLHDAGYFAFKSGEPRTASSQRGKTLQLVLRLKKCQTISCLVALLIHANAIDNHVGFLQLVDDLA